MTVIFQKSIIVLLALAISLPLHAERLYPKESRESEMPLCPQDEELIAQLETILDETVSKALDTQYMELNANFRKESNLMYLLQRMSGFGVLPLLYSSMKLRKTISQYSST